MTEYYVCKNGAKLKLANKRYVHVYMYPSFSNKHHNKIGLETIITDCLILVENLTDEERTLLSLTGDLIKKVDHSDDMFIDDGIRDVISDHSDWAKYWYYTNKMHSPSL